MAKSTEARVDRRDNSAGTESRFQRWCFQNCTKFLGRCPRLAMKLRRRRGEIHGKLIGSAPKAPFNIKATPQESVRADIRIER
jgi:hypothetical protein